MPSIRIIATPPGEAPQSIREAWIGTVIPLPRGRRSRLLTARGFGVVSGASSLVGQLWGLFTRRGERTTGYGVHGEAAVAALSMHRPDAAAWWRNNTPHVLRRGQFLMFDAEVCELILDES